MIGLLPSHILVTLITEKRSPVYGTHVNDFTRIEL